MRWSFFGKKVEIGGKSLMTETEDRIYPALGFHVSVGYDSQYFPSVTLFAYGA